MLAYEVDSMKQRKCLQHYFIIFTSNHFEEVMVSILTLGHKLRKYRHCFG
jgi:hypothetical protein